MRILLLTSIAWDLMLTTDALFDRDATVDQSQLPLPVKSSSTPHKLPSRSFGILLVLIGAIYFLYGSSQYFPGKLTSGNQWSISFSGRVCSPLARTNFFHSSVRTDELCPSVANASSYSGWIGLEGDSDNTPKRSFYWLFEAEEYPKDAPVILSIGGGPGTSGMINPLGGQSHCKINEDGMAAYPHRWTQKYNLLALDHPIGVGLSYGTMVNNSVAAAHDVYDFLQKFYRVYPRLARNRFVIASGSYGGRYVPLIATVIQEENMALARGEGKPGSTHINLDTLLISSPWTDPMAYYRWLLYYRCELHPFYSSTTCADLYGRLPECLDLIEMAYQNSTADNRYLALKTCIRLRALSGQNETLTENISRQCNAKDSIAKCYPSFTWLPEFFNSNETRKVLGVPDHVEYNSQNEDVGHAFDLYGDHIFPTHKLYEPLISNGIRVLHHAGSLDANCANPGTFSFLKLLNTSFSEAFRAEEDAPWPSAGERQGTVRVAGLGAGNFTYLTYDNAGHFIVSDQTWQTKYVVEHFIDNVPFVAA